MFQGQGLVLAAAAAVTSLAWLALAMLEAWAILLPDSRSIKGGWPRHGKVRACTLQKHRDLSTSMSHLEFQHLPSPLPPKSSNFVWCMGASCWPRSPRPPCSGPRPCCPWPQRWWMASPTAASPWSRRSRRSPRTPRRSCSGCARRGIAWGPCS